jgi:DNA modification methylase
VLPTLPDASVDMVLCDLPYGTTACKWDVVIPFAPLWEQYRRVVKRNGAIVLFGSQPFTSLLITSNLPMFRYELIWEKSSPTGFLDAPRRPLKVHENILVFAHGNTTYNPQKWEVAERFRDRRKAHMRMANNTPLYGGHWKQRDVEDGTRYPLSVIPIPSAYKEEPHPTQKPIALGEYLIRTYTNEGEVVLDNAMGVGSFGVAAMNTGRDFIGIEKDTEHGYFEIAARRIEAARVAPRQLELFAAV